jgi:3-methyladenine DNA glycosylase/8-oxoguanine DNA glycosylase
MKVGADGVWRSTRTPDGPATVHYRCEAGVVRARAWGPGAELELAAVPRLLGEGDDPAGFDPGLHPVMAQAHARFGAGWRVPRTGRVLEALVPAIVEQRVTGRQARASWAWLVGRFGTPAPGPGDGRAPALLVAPGPTVWARIPSWAWHAAGVDPARSRAIVAAAGRAEALEQLCEREPPAASLALRALPGVGIWTAAEVAARAWGDADAVSFGDYHLADHVVHALTGRRGGTDEQMAELLQPWAGQRGRAVRMLQLHCPPPPRRGPRARITDHRRW